MQRITIKFLKAQCERLNRITDSPMNPHEDVDGKYVPQPLNYHISQAYGGYSLHRMCKSGSGITDIFRCGHIPARDLSNRIDAYIRGTEA